MTPLASCCSRGPCSTSFKDGPFAWNGLFAWWIPLTVFFGWFVVMFVMTNKAINQQLREAESLPRMDTSAMTTPAGASGTVTR